MVVPKVYEKPALGQSAKEAIKKKKTILEYKGNQRFG